jgi:hypothetical protein
MDAPGSLTADVFVAAAGGQELAREAADAFRSAGVDPTTSLAPTRRGLDTLQWAVLAVLPLNAFLGSLGSKLGTDAYEALRGLVRRILRRSDDKASIAAPLVLLDSESGIRVVLEPDLPLDSFRQLFALDLASIDGRVLRYAPSKGTWNADRGDASATPDLAPRPTAAVPWTKP